ncbi:hypothetical protein RB653_000728 [Dictyostelium firmibasis]|uniref:Uncharacterized protein n=1 Tax=Dictyostelium firmibasis TaxID=79012 RepID=A0AAN7TVM7_9MYCE
MSKHNIIVGIITIIFLGAVIGLNVYSFLPNTDWYQFTFSLLVSATFGINRGGLMGENGNNIEWNTSSKTENTIYTCFAFVIVSFVFGCVMLLITIVALFKRVHKKGRKALFVMSILLFIFNVLATLLFLRLNKALCQDATDGLTLPFSMEKDLLGSDICSKFKGSDSIFSWGPAIGWYCSLAASVISFVTIFLTSSILHTRRFGYHVIH